MGAGRSAGQFRKLEDRYVGYEVYDRDGDKIGSVDATYVDEANQREYLAVSEGLSGLLPGTSGSNFIPIDLCRSTTLKGPSRPPPTRTRSKIPRP